MSYRTIHDPEYSRENTELMIRALIDQGGVQMIFFEDEAVNARINQSYGRPIMLSITKPAHDNHIHVRWWASEEERIGSSGRGFFRVAGP